MSVPVSFFYSDARGVDLYRRITESEEYYPHRCEAALAREDAARLAAALPPRAAILEIGCGDGSKLAPVLRRGDFEYIPNDISREFLARVVSWYREHAPDVPVSPCCRDAFSGDWSGWEPPAGRPLVLAWMGSSIGNLGGARAAARQLRRWVRALAPEAMLLGCDLWRPGKEAALRRAYDNPLTEQFIRNGLRNYCVSSGVPMPEAGRYEVRVDRNGCVTMGLDLEREGFRPLEVSRKFAPGALAALWRDAGLAARDSVVDEEHYYTIVALSPTPRGRSSSGPRSPCAGPPPGAAGSRTAA